MQALSRNLQFALAWAVWLIMQGLTLQILIIFVSDDGFVPCEIPCLCVREEWVRERPLEFAHNSLGL